MGDAITLYFCRIGRLVVGAVLDGPFGWVVFGADFEVFEHLELVRLLDGGQHKLNVRAQRLDTMKRCDQSYRQIAF